MTHGALGTGTTTCHYGSYYPNVKSTAVKSKNYFWWSMIPLNPALSLCLTWVNCQQVMYIYQLHPDINIIFDDKLMH